MKRVEADSLGSVELGADCFHGVHTARAVDNFPISGQRMHPRFIGALAQVKLACAEANMVCGHLEKGVGEAVIRACREMATGALHEHVLVDAYQGGAGTSANMNVNEVIASRAAEIMGGERGDRALVHPLHHVNMHQSTNDVFPTALAVAALDLFKILENRISGLQEAFQDKEHEFANVLCVGRTELMDAVPMTLGMAFGAHSEAFARDRWRIFKCRERIKRVNLGGTAVGTGLGAPREYILQVVEKLKAVTGLPLSRSNNLVDATQNLDRFVEVSGMLRTYAANLLKVASDLRLRASGPATGLGEISLPSLQAGSSIMAGKVNPVIPEAVSQVALRVMGNDHVLSMAASMGQLELNHLMPLVAHSLLESLELLGNVTRIFTAHVRGIEACVDRCREHARSSAALATMFVPALGYELVRKLLEQAMREDKSFQEILQEQGLADREAVERLLRPESMHKLGFTEDDFQGVNKP